MTNTIRARQRITTNIKYAHKFNATTRIYIHIKMNLHDVFGVECLMCMCLEYSKHDVLMT